LSPKTTRSSSGADRAEFLKGGCRLRLPPVRVQGLEFFLIKGVHPFFILDDKICHQTPHFSSVVASPSEPKPFFGRPFSRVCIILLGGVGAPPDWRRPPPFPWACFVSFPSGGLYLAHILRVIQFFKMANVNLRDKPPFSFFLLTAFPPLGDSVYF